MLIDAGANPNTRSTDDEHGETPLHWTASSDDVDVALALIDGGADIETPDGSIGPPLDNAVGYCCWHVARLLATRGARVDKLWHAAALGMLDRLEDLLAPGIDQEQISQGFWHACVAGQRRAAERLLSAGADLNCGRDSVGRRGWARDSPRQRDRVVAFQRRALGPHFGVSFTTSRRGHLRRAQNDEGRLARRLDSPRPIRQGDRRSPNPSGPYNA